MFLFTDMKSTKNRMNKHKKTPAKMPKMIAASLYSFETDSDLQSESESNSSTSIIT